jgi:transcriptional regulator with XRE-family HTH domain
MLNDSADPAMLKARKLFERSGRSLEELGVAMGYEPGVGRRAAWQFLNKTSDPRLSMLRRFCKALGIGVKDLL